VNGHDHPDNIRACTTKEYRSSVNNIITEYLPLLSDSTTFTHKLKQAAQQKNVPLKELFWFVRLALMESTKGPGIHELITMLGSKESEERIEHALDLFRKIL